MYLPTRQLKIQRRRMAQEARKLRRLVLVSVLLWAFLFALPSALGVKFRSPIYFEEPEIISPLPDDEATPSAKPKPAPPGARIIKAALAKEPDFITGEASYYSREGCLGCNESYTMANGQELDDTAFTLALTPEEVSSGKRLNDMVTVQNLENGQTVRARVTDTGGFEKYGRVADLSVATKNAINCPNLCTVKVIYE